MSNPGKHVLHEIRRGLEDLPLRSTHPRNVYRATLRRMHLRRGSHELSINPRRGRHRIRALSPHVTPLNRINPPGIYRDGIRSRTGKEMGLDKVSQQKLTLRTGHHVVQNKESHVQRWKWKYLSVTGNDRFIYQKGVHRNMDAKNRTKEYVKLIKTHIEAIEELLYLIQEDGVLPTPDAEADAIDIARHVRTIRADAEMLYKRLVASL